MESLLISQVDVTCYGYALIKRLLVNGLSCIGDVVVVGECESARFEYEVCVSQVGRGGVGVDLNLEYGFAVITHLLIFTMDGGEFLKTDLTCYTIALGGN